MDDEMWKLHAEWKLQHKQDQPRGHGQAAALNVQKVFPDVTQTKMKRASHEAELLMQLAKAKSENDAWEDYLRNQHNNLGEEIEQEANLLSSSALVQSVSKEIPTVANKATLDSGKRQEKVDPGRIGVTSLESRLLRKLTKESDNDDDDSTFRGSSPEGGAWSLEEAGATLQIISTAGKETLFTDSCCDPMSFAASDPSHVTAAERQVPSPQFSPRDSSILPSPDSALDPDKHDRFRLYGPGAALRAVWLKNSGDPQFRRAMLFAAAQTDSEGARAIRRSIAQRGPPGLDPPAHRSMLLGASQTNSRVAGETARCCPFDLGQPAAQAMPSAPFHKCSEATMVDAVQRPLGFDRTTKEAMLSPALLNGFDTTASTEQHPPFGLNLPKKQATVVKASRKWSMTGTGSALQGPPGFDPSKMERTPGKVFFPTGDAATHQNQRRPGHVHSFVWQ